MKTKTHMQIVGVMYLIPVLLVSWAMANQYTPTQYIPGGAEPSATQVLTQAINGCVSKATMAYKSPHSNRLRTERCAHAWVNADVSIRQGIVRAAYVSRAKIGLPSHPVHPDTPRVEWGNKQATAGMVAFVQHQLYRCLKVRRIRFNETTADNHAATVACAQQWLKNPAERAEKERILRVLDI